jgi:hypothetical protein
MSSHPTAAQVLGVMQDTLSSAFAPSPGSPAGTLIADQRVPFHLAAPAASPLPTARQSELDVHDTPLNEASSAGRLGVRRIDQEAPLQRSASPPFPALLPHVPTAMHARRDVHDTLDSDPYQSGVGGLGVRAIDHVEPSQRSTNGSEFSVDGLSAEPTATQSILDVHDTPLRPGSVKCAGCGTGWIDHTVASADCHPAITERTTPQRRSTKRATRRHGDAAPRSRSTRPRCGRESAVTPVFIS